MIKGHACSLLLTDAIRYATRIGGSNSRTVSAIPGHLAQLCYNLICGIILLLYQVIN